MASTLASAAAALLLTGTGHAQTDPYNALARDIFKELIEINTTENNIRAHGQDENVGVESFYRGNEFFYRYLKTITSH